MPDGEREDARVWIGRLERGHEEEHAQFVAWLGSAEGQEVFRRRRLTEYLLVQQGDILAVLFKAPHTGDPRIMIDFLRYPGVWPAYWTFVGGGRLEDTPFLDHADSDVKVHWRRGEGG